MLQIQEQTKIAQQALDNHAEQLTTEFPTFEKAQELFLDVFGEDSRSSDNLASLQSQFTNGILRPEIRFVSSETLTDDDGNIRDAAFDNESQTILLSENLNAAGIASSIEQELGHWWDVQLNGAVDTTTTEGNVFDEGAAYAERFGEGAQGDNIFADVVYQNDSQTILVDGKETNVEFRPIATWNIQGATSRDTNTWEDVFTVMNEPGQGLKPIEVMSIQEAGNPGRVLGIQPTSQTTVGRGEIVQYDVNRDGQNFKIYWTLGGLGQNEKNLAIVLRNASAEQLFWLPNPTNPDNRRPVLGVQNDGKIYFLVHAVASGNNNDAEAILDKLYGGDAVFNQYYQENNIGQSRVFALGDFNRNIASSIDPVQNPASAIANAYQDPRYQEALIPPDATTQNARLDPTIRTLDYLFTESALLKNEGTVLNGLVDRITDQNRENFPSDHFPVVYDDELASLNGDQIQYEVFSPNLQTSLTGSQTTTVGEGVELNDFSALNSNLVDVNVDLSGAGGGVDTNSISFRVDDAAGSGTFSSAEFNGYVFSNIGGDSQDFLPIDNVTIDPSTNSLGVDPSNITFTSDTINVNVAGLDYSAGEGFDLRVEL